MSKFPLLTGIAMEVRVMFFIVQYIYVSSYVDWFGLISINILEGFGYLLFVSSYTILISFFGALPILNAELRGSKLQEGKGSAMVQTVGATHPRRLHRCRRRRVCGPGL